MVRSSERRLHPSPRVRLVRMTHAERDEALRGEAIEYAEQKSRAGFWPRDESLARATAEIAGFVGSDPAARGHEFFVGMDRSGHRVGWLWYGPVPGSKASPGKRWLFQILVDEPLRGKGYGRGLLEALERHLAGEGTRELALNVFRWNSVAISLYRSAGYKVSSETKRNLAMRKRLPHD